jgi:uncharacterized protein YecE (DUF72 family)
MVPRKVRLTRDATQMRGRILIGTAGWSIPRTLAERFSGDGSHLERYARRVGCVEINTSFHRPHAAETYAKWAAATPARFRFAVKMPRTITHDLQLRHVRAHLDAFLHEIAGLGRKRGPLLLQLPPSFVFDPRVVGRFLDLLRRRYDGAMVCEPRHASWLSAQAEALLVRHAVARVAADPPRMVGADRPSGWPGLVYYRLHGSPRTYWSSYTHDYLAALAATLRQISVSVPVWCVFDNTASGAALENAWELRTLIGNVVAG